MIEILFFMGYVFFTMMYIIILGNDGFTFFKLHVPFFKKRGAWFVKEYSTKRVSVSFEEYKAEVPWPNKNVKTYIKQPFSHTPGGDPIIFAKEGTVANFDFFKDVEPDKGGEWFSQLLIKNWNAAWNAAKASMDGQSKTDMLVIIILAGVLLGIIILLVLNFGQTDILTKFAENFETYRPAIESAIASSGSDASKLV